MKQLVQNMGNGNTSLEEVPVPLNSSGRLLIRSTVSLVSLGTERMLVNFGKASYLEKARQQPEKVKMVLDKVKSEGLMPTVNAVRNKLGTPLPLGYCNVGIVEGVGKGVKGFKVGDRVTSNGSHSEFVSVPENLVAKIPSEVTEEQASFTVIASIGLQGIRLINPTFGETIVVYGLGLIGLLTARLLRANGCRVIGIDIDDSKLKIAEADGVIPVKGGDATLVNEILSLTGGIGADGVLITASAKVESIISDAANMSRQRGRIVLVGVVPLNLSRNEFYTKELSFQVSCSYGPGRYDSNYEEGGQDYPIGFVRWTEKRNFEAILNAMVNGSLKVDDLITQRSSISKFEDVYGDMSASGQIASLLTYDTTAEDQHQREVALGNASSHVAGGKNLAIIGAGNFTSATMLPQLQAANAPIQTIVSRGGLTATTLAKKFNVQKASSDYAQTLKDELIGMVAITTRHNLHANMVLEALAAGKDVFVEKPLALSKTDLDSIIVAKNKSGKTVTVGFNRRFSPHSVAIKKRLPGGALKNIVATMNAGFIPSDVWVHDLEVGGGRLVGEACHFIDLISYFTDSEVVAVCANSLGQDPEINSDNASILLKYASGDLGTINYFSNGSKAYSKERVEIYAANTTVVMDNFRRTDWYGYSGSSKLKTSMDKGHAAQFKLLTERLNKGGEALIPFDSIINTSKASLAILESLQSGAWVEVK